MGLEAATTFCSTNAELMIEMILLRRRGYNLLSQWR